MDIFGPTLYREFGGLSMKDCTPIEDVGYRIKYGDSLASPFRLEIAFSPHAMEVRHLFIRGDLKGLGFGRLIASELKRSCVRGEFTRIELLDVLPESTGFWKKCGFHVVGRHGRWSNPMPK